MPFGPQATPTCQGEEGVEFGRHALVSSTSGQGDEHHDQMGQRELAAAREVLGAVCGERLHEVQEQSEQTLIKLGRGRRFFESSWLILV